MENLALITGAGRGIGLGIAQFLAKEGVKVILTDKDTDSLRMAFEHNRDSLPQAAIASMDVTNPESVQETIEKITGDYGQIDILVNNAGIVKDKLAIRMETEEWDRVLEVNLKGTFLCSKAVIKGMMRKRWGRIINISSIVGIMGNPGQANYAASKAGIIGLTKTLARELAGRGITVNAIAPGYIETEMTNALPEKTKNALLSMIPCGRLGSISDIAHTVLFLASDGAQYITGQVINVNGGMYM
ncbi:MAG: 3-oxoacyl-[acyl-carrier-protein] reductase [bacterium]